MQTAIIGYPYIGANREWKKITENYWKQNTTEEEFLAEMKRLRLHHLDQQQALGLDVITVGDFTFYDRMLDLAVVFGMVPARYEEQEEEFNLATYYAMARGANYVVASEMTKWFNTNYHYIVPEYGDKPLKLTENPYIDYFLEAKQHLNTTPRVTLIGPYTFLTLTKGLQKKDQPGFVLQLIQVYRELLQSLQVVGAEWVQLEEPAFARDLSAEDVQLIEVLYRQLTEGQLIQVMVTSYFEGLSAYEKLVHLPVDGFGLDFVNGYEENMHALRAHGFPKDKVLAIGLISGRDIWRANLAERTILVETIQQLCAPKEIWLQSSCSLQHVPVSKVTEQHLFDELYQALAFADEKIAELQIIKHYVLDKQTVFKSAISDSLHAIESLESHISRNNEAVVEAFRHLQPSDFKRTERYARRSKLQQAFLQLPDYPTTTIGSFPQSVEVKRNRAQWRKGEITQEAYEQFNRKETARWIAIQEQLGLDVLVHGEFERTDMVEYFGEKLDGFAFTANGWVVSYGSRCVKPPVIYGDVDWIAPMTVKETKWAQQQTTKLVKGMLTGPVTILNWSFVRDDLQRETVVQQIAFALRKEVKALEQAGIYIIQVDEPALKEGLPMRKSKQKAYIQAGIDAFRLSTAVVRDTTQIHTHMCYCEFNDFIGVIEALDADVISIETSRSHGELINVLKENPYKLGIGLGVYDIHSPRIPAVDEMMAILKDSAELIAKEQFWINPDCGLKTRNEHETVAALKNMVAAAQILKQG